VSKQLLVMKEILNCINHSNAIHYEVLTQNLDQPMVLIYTLVIGNRQLSSDISAPLSYPRDFLYSYSHFSEIMALWRGIYE